MGQNNIFITYPLFVPLKEGFWAGGVGGFVVKYSGVIWNGAEIPEVFSIVTVRETIDPTWRFWPKSMMEESLKLIIYIV